MADDFVSITLEPYEAEQLRKFNERVREAKRRIYEGLGVPPGLLAGCAPNTLSAVRARHLRSSWKPTPPARTYQAELYTGSAIHQADKD